MREQFDKELKKAVELKKYSPERASGLLDDLATAYISRVEYGHLDNALIAVRTAKKALRSQGISRTEINDLFLERSYLSKTTLKQMRTESIFSGDTVTLKPIISEIPAFFTDKTTTDLIIERLEREPSLLNALKKDVAASNLTRDYGVKNSTLLKNFYSKHKDIIS